MNLATEWKTRMKEDDPHLSTASGAVIMFLGRVENL
jgi:hypothetical protein